MEIRHGRVLRGRLLRRRCNGRLLLPEPPSYGITDTVAALHELGVLIEVIPVDPRLVMLHRFGAP